MKIGRMIETNYSVTVPSINEKWTNGAVKITTVKKDESLESFP